jgi:hypothetical protein
LRGVIKDAVISDHTIISVSGFVLPDLSVEVEMDLLISDRMKIVFL